MKTVVKRAAAIIMSLSVLAAMLTVSVSAAENDSVKDVLNSTMAKLAKTVPEPKFGTGGGEWTVIALARGGYLPIDSDYFKGYYDRITETVKELAAEVDQNGALHSRKYTENSRLIMALSAIDKDPADVGGVNIIAPLNDFDKTVWQGINGPVFALIALDTRKYDTDDTEIRQKYIDKILSLEIEGGGWALFGSSADPDITAMALQALAAYRDDEKVNAAAERAFTKLSEIQGDNGGYGSWGSVNAESIAQVVVACTAWGINPNTDERFVKNGNSALDALLGFYSEDDAAFRHIMSGPANAMATDQACYALVAYDRFVNGKTSLYDMSDLDSVQDNDKETSDGGKNETPDKTDTGITDNGEDENDNKPSDTNVADDNVKAENNTEKSDKTVKTEIPQAGDFTCVTVYACIMLMSLTVMVVTGKIKDEA